MSIAFAGDELRCPLCWNTLGELLSFQEQGLDRCRGTIGGRWCGAYLYIAPISVHSEEGPGMTVMAVTQSEIEQLNRSGKSPRQVLEILGLVYAPHGARRAS